MVKSSIGRKKKKKNGNSRLLFIIHLCSPFLKFLFFLIAFMILIFSSEPWEHQFLQFEKIIFTLSICFESEYFCKVQMLALER